MPLSAGSRSDTLESSFSSTLCLSEVPALIITSCPFKSSSPFSTVAFNAKEVLLLQTSESRAVVKHKILIFILFLSFGWNPCGQISYLAASQTACPHLWAARYFIFLLHTRECVGRRAYPSSEYHMRKSRDWNIKMRQESHVPGIRVGVVMTTFDAATRIECASGSSFKFELMNAVTTPI